MGIDLGGGRTPQTMRTPTATVRTMKKNGHQKVKTMVVASQSNGGIGPNEGRQRRKSRGDLHNDITAPPVINEAAELEIVGRARPRLHQLRGPTISGGNIVSRGLSTPKVFASPDDIRKRTIVTQHIVLGCREDAMDARMLQGIGVTHVLNTCSQLPHYHPNDFIYHKIPILDTPKAPIVTCCEVAANFLQRVESVGGRCLVHCIAGSSRSVTLAIMHLMISHRVPLHIAFHHINRMRPQANPNLGFKLQLALLEVKVLGGSSVAGKDAGEQWSFYEWNVRKATVPKIKERFGKGPKTAKSASEACSIQ